MAPGLPLATPRGSAQVENTPCVCRLASHTPQVSPANEGKRTRVGPLLPPTGADTGHVPVPRPKRPVTHRVLCSVPATHRVLRHGDFLGVLCRGLLGLPHPPCQNQAEAAAQSGNTSKQPAGADPRHPVTSKNQAGLCSRVPVTHAQQRQKNESKAYHPVSLFPEGRALGTLPVRSFSQEISKR